MMEGGWKRGGMERERGRGGGLLSHIQSLRHADTRDRLTDLGHAKEAWILSARSVIIGTPWTQCVLVCVCGLPKQKHTPIHLHTYSNTPMQTHLTQCHARDACSVSWMCVTAGCE